MRNNSI
jgi:hypothetical protein